MSLLDWLLGNQEPERRGNENQAPARDSNPVQNPADGVARELLDKLEGRRSAESSPSREKLCRAYDNERINKRQFIRLLKKFDRFQLRATRRGPIDDNTCDTCIQAMGLSVLVGTDLYKKFAPPALCERGQKCRCYFDLGYESELSSPAKVVHSAWHFGGYVYVKTDEELTAVQERGLQVDSWHAQKDLENDD